MFLGLFEVDSINNSNCNKVFIIVEVIVKFYYKRIILIVGKLDIGVEINVIFKIGFDKIIVCFSDKVFGLL